MQSTWPLTRETVTNTVTPSPAVVSAAAPAATSLASGPFHRRGARAGVATCRVTGRAECIRAQEVSR